MRWERALWPIALANRALGVLSAVSLRRLAPRLSRESIAEWTLLKKRGFVLCHDLQCMAIVIQRMGGNRRGAGCRLGIGFEAFG